jgi:hypothetical protein
MAHGVSSFSPFVPESGRKRGLGKHAATAKRVDVEVISRLVPLLVIDRIDVVVDLTRSSRLWQKG